MWKCLQYGYIFYVQNDEEGWHRRSNPELQYDPNIFMDMRQFPGLYVCFEHTSDTQYERQICLHSA